MFTNLLTVLLALLCFTNVSFCDVEAFIDNGSDIKFEDKIELNLNKSSYKDLSVEEDDETNLDSGVDVVLQFENSFSCSHNEINTYEDVLEHREELKNFYTKFNSDIVSSLNLSDCNQVVISNYGPFIEYNYDSLDEFNNTDFKILNKTNYKNLEKVYVDEYELVDCASRDGGESTVSFYSFSKALKDVGISTNKTYTGNGIKIGSIENCIPNNFVNLEGVSYEVYGTSTDVHSFRTSSIFGGTSGIANNASLYFAALSEHSFLDCANWLIGNGVQIINMSCGWENGKYDSNAAYADYLVSQTKVTFICSVGNRGDSGLLCSPATGLNVISVASNNADFSISHFSSAGVQDSCNKSLVNPTLAAPGGWLFGIANVNDILYGTSFAAPIVTGIVALLMEEFPTLSAHPEEVMALLSNSCNRALGQTSIYDHDAGFGIVNYEKARSNFANSILNEVRGNYTLLMSKGVTLRTGDSIHACLSLLFNSKQTTPNGELCNIDYSDLKIAIANTVTNEVYFGETISNYSFVNFTNNSNYTKFGICVYLNSTRTTVENEFYSISYEITERTNCYTVEFYDGDITYAYRYDLSTQYIYLPTFSKVGYKCVLLSFSNGIMYSCGDKFYLTQDEYFLIGWDEY